MPVLPEAVHLYAERVHVRAGGRRHGEVLGITNNGRLRVGSSASGSLIRTDGLEGAVLGGDMTQPAQPSHPARDEAAPASDPKRSIDVAGVVATHLACCREVAAEVGADSRDGRSGEGEPGSGAASAPLTGNPGRRVGANR
jgi:hypothetical protein